MSDVDASSSPLAAARFIMPSMPSTISADFHPAIAIYSIAWPASVAENCVVAPISLAFASIAANSCAVAPDIAATVDIWLSNAFPTSTEAAATPAIAVPAATIPAIVSFAAPPANLPSVAICLLTVPIALPKELAILPAISTVISC